MREIIQLRGRVAECTPLPLSLSFLRGFAVIDMHIHTLSTEHIGDAWGIRRDEDGLGREREELQECDRVSGVGSAVGVDERREEGGDGYI